MNWIRDNLLSLYGAIVGTIALFLNFGGFWIAYKKSLRKLTVESSIDEYAQGKLDELAKPKDAYGCGSTLCGPIYKITVINACHVQMHVFDVGVTAKSAQGEQKLQALVRSGSNGFLSRLNDIGGEDIPAGARKTFDVWLSSKPEIPHVVGCYVVDQMGKEYKGKHTTRGQVLNVANLDLTP